MTLTTADKSTWCFIITPQRSTWTDWHRMMHVNATAQAFIGSTITLCHVHKRIKHQATTDDNVFWLF